MREYDTEVIAKVRTAYLSCFSIARDDLKQWKRYGENGEGVCLGVRVINEPEPQSKELFSRLIEVLYSEEELRNWFSDWVGKMCAAIREYPATKNNVDAALAQLRGVAAFGSIRTKTSDWSSEQEVRHVTLDKLEPGVKPNVRISNEGKTVRYLPVSLRADDKLIALDEIIVGSKQNLDEVQKQFEEVLVTRGYKLESIEYPKFTLSSVHF